ncbi:response regulator [Roseixanthobacter glucoisosaccharinicivorans]|uniref:response regulator n=1 Tax=Roseixanthobacter glucoisosaccharinicivorans TaxID=3119923 RepID=UPI00372ADF16
MSTDAGDARSGFLSGVFSRRTSGRERLVVGGAAFAGGIVVAALEGSPGGGITAILAALAAVGIFAVVSATMRLWSGTDKRSDELVQALLANMSDAAIVVEAGERMLAVNTPYLNLSRSAAGQVPMPDRFLGRIPGGQAMVGLLLRSAADGVRGMQTFPFDPNPAGRRLVVSVQPLAGARRALWVLHLAGETVPSAPLAQVAGGTPLARPSAAQTSAPLLPAEGALALAEIWEQAPVGMVLLSSAGGRLANAAFARWLGYGLAELGAGVLPFVELIGPQSTTIARAVLERGQTGPRGIDLDFVRQDGSIVSGRVWIGGRAGADCIAVVIPRGDAMAVSAVVERQAQEPPQRMSGGSDASFFSRSPLAMANVDGAGAVREANGSFARLFAGSDRMLAGTKLEQLVAERDVPAMESLVRETLSGQAGGAPVDVGIAGQGGRSARLYAANLGPGGAGAAIYAVDTTAQRALEAQFAQSQKMQAIGQLAGGVAHDFNNVLTAILGYCDLLLANHRPSDPSFPDIMQIKQNANRAAGLVRQLLAFSRRQTLRPQVIQLTDVISDLSMLLRRLMGESISLQVEHGRELWPILVDVNQFEQVIVNLAVNARDAMPSGGVVTLRTLNVPAAACAAYGDASNLAPADYVLVEVGDTGTGMPPDILEKIFEPFFSTKDVGKGTGLGLSTVYGIVKQTGGSVLATSELGKGSLFRVFLPRHEGAVEETPARPAEPEAKVPDLTGQASVLLVEDEDAVRAFAARALSARGYRVVAAANGAEALEAMDQPGTNFDVVVSDVVMPEMDGPSLLRELRRRDPKLKIIFISGYAEEAFAKNLPEGERFAFLPKPFSLKQLVAAVKEATRP